MKVVREREREMEEKSREEGGEQRKQREVVNAGVS